MTPRSAAIARPASSSPPRTCSRRTRIQARRPSARR
jgi:hypothetical protein